MARPLGRGTPVSVTQGMQEQRERADPQAERGHQCLCACMCLHTRVHTATTGLKEVREGWRSERGTAVQRQERTCYVGASRASRSPSGGGRCC